MFPSENPIAPATNKLSTFFDLPRPVAELDFDDVLDLGLCVAPALMLERLEDLAALVNELGVIGVGGEDSGWAVAVSVVGVSSRSCSEFLHCKSNYTKSLSFPRQLHIWRDRDMRHNSRTERCRVYNKSIN